MTSSSLTQGDITVHPPDYTFEQLSNNTNSTPGDMVFSTFTWFGAAGAAVTFTATPPPGAPPLTAVPQIYDVDEGLDLDDVDEAMMQLEDYPSPGDSSPSPEDSPSAPPGQDAQGMAGWKIGLVVGLVVGVSLLVLGLILGLLCKMRRCCWGRKDDEAHRYELKVWHDAWVGEDA